MNPEAVKKFDLSCLGILVLDIFGRSIDRFPEKGTSEYFNDLQIHPGGCAYNTAVDAARLGLRVGVLGKLGRDVFGDVISRSLQRERIDTLGVCLSDEKHTAFSFVMVPEDGQRRIYHSMGVNSTYGPEELDHEIIAASRSIHIAGVPLFSSFNGIQMVDLLRHARSEGILTSMDPVVKPDIAEYILPCLPYLDVFLPNTEESVYITGLTDPPEQLRFYLDRGVELAGIKLGDNGALISNGRETLRVGVYKVPVVDTCGAGDAFVAGFLYGVLQRWEMDRSARFATAVSAFCIQSVGASISIQDASEVLVFMDENELVIESLQSIGRV